MSSSSDPLTSLDLEALAWMGARDARSDDDDVTADRRWETTFGAVTIVDMIT
jgi:hypothetical protein